MLLYLIEGSCSLNTGYEGREREGGKKVYIEVNTPPKRSLERNNNNGKS